MSVNSQPSQPAAPAAAGPDRRSPLGVAAGLTAMAAWAASGVIAKGLDMGGLAIVLYRTWMYAVIVVAILAATGRRLSRHTLRISAAGGVGLGLDIALFFSAVKQTTMANATVIGALQPVLMLVVARRLFGERVRGRDVALSGVAVAGVVVVMFGSSGLPDAHPSGDLLAFGALFAWTAYLVFSKRTQAEVSPLEYSAATAVWAAVVVTPLAVLSGQDLSVPSGGDLLWLVLLALVPGLVGHGLMNWSLTRIPIWLGATLGLAVPVTSTLLAWAFIDEQVDPLQFLGMAIAVGALAWLVGASQRPGRAAVEVPEEPAAPAATPAPAPLQPGSGT